MAFRQRSGVIDAAPNGTSGSRKDAIRPCLQTAVEAGELIAYWSGGLSGENPNIPHGPHDIPNGILMPAPLIPKLALEPLPLGGG